MDKKKMTRDKEDLLERKAKALKKYLKTEIRHDFNFLPRPFIIEITGTPDAGKSTTIDELYKFLKNQKLRVLPPQEGAERFPHIPRNTPLYNIRTGIYAWEILVDKSHMHDLDVIIFDRGLFDAYTWMMYWKGKNQLTPEEERLFQWFFTFRLWIDKIDLCYFMICDPEKSIERNKKIALSDKFGETSNPATITTLVERYKKAYELLSPQYPQLRLIDTTNMDEQKMVSIIASDMLETLEKKIETESNI